MTQQPIYKTTDKGNYTAFVRTLQQEKMPPVHSGRIWTTLSSVMFAALIFTASVLIWQIAYVAAANDQWVNIKNEAGRKSAVTLPDGSEVLLGAGSSIRYNKYFGSRNREIELEGEAYFIARDQHQHPFTVLSGPLITKGVGTEFNVRYFQHKSDIEVSVLKGTAEVIATSDNKPENITRLIQQQRLRFNYELHIIQLDSLSGDGQSG